MLKYSHNSNIFLKLAFIRCLFSVYLGFFKETTSMLVNLQIQNFALVESLDLDFEKGMTVLTGETGAGKSILLGALGLALGDRAETTAFADAEKKAEINAEFDIKDLPLAQEWLKQQEFEFSENLCVLRRSIAPNGRSKSWINSQPCQISQLKDLGNLLLDLHGQHEHQSLLRIETHIDLLDEYANLQPKLHAYNQTYADWQTTNHKIKLLREESLANQSQIELWKYQLKELEELNLLEGELEKLEAEQTQLANAEDIIQKGMQAIKLLDNEDGALAQLNSALKLVEKIPLASMENIVSLLNEAQIQLEEAQSELSPNIENINLDAGLLDEVEKRLALIYATGRKHQIQPEELPNFTQNLRKKLQGLDLETGDLAQLEQKSMALEAKLQEQSEILTQERISAIRVLSEKINTHLLELKLAENAFSIEISGTENFTNKGKDKVEFLIAPNLGSTPKPLAKIASGGELSRISLAIQVVLAENSKIPTLIFDEVDVGISGATAEIVGKLLNKLAKFGQIICVTHLPQVAAQGDWHLFIYKEIENQKTKTKIDWLDNDGRIKELARLLGGVEITQTSLDHAKNMLAKRA